MGSNATIEESAERYRKTYDTPLSALLSRIWGGHLHMGLFESPDEPLLDAQLRATRRMADAAGLRAGQEVVEAACGVGGTARYLAATYGARITATNIAEAQLEEGRALTAKAGLSHLIDFAFADYHDLPFPDGRFDLWWCQEALLYAADKKRVIEEATRVLRPGGRLVISDLLLAESVTGTDRERFTATLKAPYMWSIERWDGLFGALPLRVVAREDLAPHTRLTFQKVLAALEAVSAEFTERIGEEAVAGTFERVRLQLDAARAGQLGWAIYVLQRS